MYFKRVKEHTFFARQFMINSFLSGCSSSSARAQEAQPKEKVVKTFFSFCVLKKKNIIQCRLFFGHLHWLPNLLFWLPCILGLAQQFFSSQHVVRSALEKKLEVVPNLQRNSSSSQNYHIWSIIFHLLLQSRNRRSDMFLTSAELWMNIMPWQSNE